MKVRQFLVNCFADGLSKFLSTLSVVIYHHVCGLW